MSTPGQAAPLLVCLALALAPSSCNDSTGPPAQATGLALSRADIALVPGGHLQLEARPAGAEAEALLDEGVEWSSLDPAVAIVDSAGRVVAVAEGATQVVATAGGAADSADVRVVLLRFTTVAAGAWHACGLTPEGEAWCWGRSSALGDSSGQPTDVPVRVSGGHTFREISSATWHTCAVTTDDRGLCWGSGALGVGDSGCSEGACTSVDSTLVPVEVAGGLRFTSISAGSFLSCGVTREAEAYCWGGNALGTSAARTSRTPIPVDGDLDFAAVSAGWRHACGLTTDGHVYCWGINSDGQLGTGDGGDSETPVRATALGDGPFTDVMVTVEGDSCAIRMDGTLLCFGENSSGQLGLGFRSDEGRTPETPAGLGPVVSVAGGVYHLCAVGVDGTAHCWGGISGFYGELGHGEFSNSNVPVQVTEVSDFVAVDVGTWHVTCGVTADHVVYCWGNVYGTEETRVNIPTRVPGQRP